MGIFDLLDKFFSLMRREKFALGFVANIQKKKTSNKYKLIDYYVENDPSLYATLRFISLTIGNAYAPYKSIHKNIVREAQTLAYCLMKYGDVVILKEPQKILPPYNLTIVDDESNIGKVSNHVITEANLYIIDEFKHNRQVFTSDEVIHLSLNREGNLVKDNVGRWTWGIYSIPPTVPLLKILEWKEFLIDSDIMWRDRLVPREHHKLNIEVPYNLIDGKTMEEKILKAQEYIRQQIEEYINNISLLESGAPYVTTKDVEIDVIEPKTKYSNPNNLVEQLTDTIIATFNVPLSAIKGRGKGSYAAELAIASYFMLTANAIVDIINQYFEWKYPDTDFESAQVVLEVWKTERFKRAALAAKIGVFDKDEIRQIAGFVPKEIEPENLVQGKLDGRTIEGMINATPGSVADIKTPSREDTKNKSGKDREIEEVH